MKLLVKKGKTSKLVRIFVQDSSSTTGAGLTGLTSGSSGLVCYRARDDDGNAGATQLSLSAGTRGTWSSGGFVEKDATNMPGVYEVGLDNAGLASGSECVEYMLKGATNMAPLVLEIQLTDFDPQDSVRLGLTAMPNVASGSAGAIITSGTGTAQLSVTSGKAAATLNATDVTGNVACDVQTIKTQSVTCGAGVTLGVYIGNATAALSVDASGRVDVSKFKGTASAGAAGYVGVDWANLTGTAATVDLSNTTIKTVETTPPTAAQIATTVWQDLLSSSDFTTAGSVGKLLVDKIDAAISSRMATFTLPTNFSSLAITGGGAVTAGTVSDKTGYGLSALESFVLASGTAGAGGASTITLQTALGADNLPKGATIKIYGGTGAGQCRGVAGYVDATKVLTVDRAWVTNPDNTSTYAILAFDAPSLNASLQVTSASVQGNVTGSVASVTAGVTVTTNNDKTGYTASTVTDKTGYALSSAGFDSIVIETGMNPRQALSIIAAVLCGVVSGAGTANITFLGAGVGTTRVQAVDDSSGNRSSVTLTLP